MALPSLTASLLRRAQVRLRETADTGNRRVFFVGPDALIGPFPGGPVCRSYGFTEALSETWRAGLGFAPSSAPVCALGHLPPRGKACGRVRTPAPTAYTETVPSFVGAGPRPARRSRTSCHLLGKARRGCGIASASIFGKPGPGGPDVIMKSHSDFARREFCFPRQVRVPRYGGSRGTANMDTECPS